MVTGTCKTRALTSDPRRAAGSVFNYVWMLRNPASFDMYMFAVAAGMLAGEGLGGVLQALLAVAKVDGSRKCCPHGDSKRTS